MPKLVTIIGARPQFIKAGPVSEALANYNRAASAPVREILVHTGQHYDYQMSQAFFDDLGLMPPDYNLGVGSASHGAQTARMLELAEGVLVNEKPGLVLVYGDTNSTLAGALAAAKLRIPVAHVEAGLRSFNHAMPEEINRLLTDRISDLLFAPTETAVANLRREGVTQGVHRVGDVMYDAVQKHLQVARARSTVLGRLQLTSKTFALATIHRAENTDQPERLRNIFGALCTLAGERRVVVPLHPRTRRAMAGWLFSPPEGLILTEPVSYFDMLVLESESSLILTDSGGVQKEAFFFRVPCVTLRNETEWVETVETGWNQLCDASPDQILHAVRQGKAGRHGAWPFGNGDAGQRIAGLIASFLHDG